MSVPIPQLPLFRVTFFYGPESVENDRGCQRCVFNVKKRSWKGGVQIAVEVADEQVTRLRQSLEFDVWIKRMLSGVPAEDRVGHESRAHELFVQEMCAIKLSLALDREVHQENTTVSSNAFLDELDHKVVQSADRIKDNILTELDLVS